MIEKYKIIDLKDFGDERGGLISFQDGINSPFDIKRVFYIYDTRGDDIVRGAHANIKSKFLLIAISGSCRVKIDLGNKIDEVLLNTPLKALYLDKMVWKEMFEFSHNAMLLVLSNEMYDENEYIRNYDEYLQIINK